VETIYERVGALDVHKAQVTACVRVPGLAGAREPDRGDHVLRRFGEDDGGRLLVDGEVPGEPCLVPVRVLGEDDDSSGERGTERLSFRVGAVVVI
jgi:hypothetical protein